MEITEKILSTNKVSDETDFALCRSGIYELLATGFLFPDDGLLHAYRDGVFVGELRESVAPLPAADGLKEAVDRLEAALGVFLRTHSDVDIKAHNTYIFGQGGAVKCPPYETEYGLENVFMKTQELADLSGFYRASGLEVSRAGGERPDHISTELEFMCLWTFKESKAREGNEDQKLESCLSMEGKFVQDHLGRWVGMFAQLLEVNDDSGFYAQLGHTADEFVSWEAGRLGVVAEKVSGPPSGGKPGDDQTICAACDPASLSK